MSARPKRPDTLVWTGGAEGMTEAPAIHRQAIEEDTGCGYVPGEFALALGLPKSYPDNPVVALIGGREISWDDLSRLRRWTQEYCDWLSYRAVMRNTRLARMRLQRAPE